MDIRIEVFYTGGGIWLSMATDKDGCRWVIDGTYDICLSKYIPPSSDEEKYDFWAEEMMWSKTKGELNKAEYKIYTLLLLALNYYGNY